MNKFKSTLYYNCHQNAKSHVKCKIETQNLNNLFQDQKNLQSFHFFFRSIGYTRCHHCMEIQGDINQQWFNVGK